MPNPPEAEHWLSTIGPRSEVARKAMAAIAVALADAHSNPQTHRRFHRWRESLGAGLEQLRTTGKRPAHVPAGNAELALLAIQTYYALLIKLVVAATYAEARKNSIWLRWSNPSHLRKEFALLESGETFNLLGLKDFLENNLFDGYLCGWSPSLELALSELLLAVRGRLEETSHPVDLFRLLYHQLIPSRWRHALGEHYTPPWLAEHVLNRLDYEPGSSLIDPACGSGIFLATAAARILQKESTPRERIGAVCGKLAGLDIHPLAVLSARATLAILLAEDAARIEDPLKFPVWQADSILMPVSIRDQNRQGSTPPWLKTYDIVAGNPPWVGWESLSEEYRRATRPLWEKYGLFPHNGMAAILGAGKKDLSMLMSYAASDVFLAEGGKLGFVITLAALKSASAGQGFRRFQLGAEVPLGVQSVDDLSELKPFAPAATRTTVIVWKKGRATQYPVPYYHWKKTTSRIPSTTATFTAMEQSTRQLHHSGQPVDPAELTSPWISAREQAFAPLRKLQGTAYYKAVEGVNSGGANGVYWLEVLETSPDKTTTTIRNLVDVGKVEVQAVETTIETNLLYPLLRGKEVKRWQANFSAWILLVQNVESRRGLPESLLRKEYPRAAAYLERFEPLLRRRAAFRRYFMRNRNGKSVPTAPYYSMFNAGSSLLSPWKVVWHRMRSQVAAAVVASHNGKPLLPQETLAFIPSENESEAYYIAGMLNSTPFAFFASSYSQAGGKGFASPHLLEKLHIPRFDAAVKSHLEVANLARACTEWNDAKAEGSLDSAAAQVWGLTVAEMQCIRYCAQEREL